MSARSLYIFQGCHQLASFFTPASLDRDVISNELIEPSVKALSTFDFQIDAFTAIRAKFESKETKVESMKCSSLYMNWLTHKTVIIKFYQ